MYSPVCVTVDNPALREISEKAPEPKFGGPARVGIGIRIHGQNEILYILLPKPVFTQAYKNDYKYPNYL